MKKKHDVLELYRTDENFIYIDISLSYYRELYNEWDFSPVRNRDLDDDLLEYLEDCFSEIPYKYKTIISINLPAAIRDPDKEEQGINSISNFFRYQMRKVRLERKMSVFQSLKYGLTGIVLLAAANSSKYFLKGKFLPEDIVTEGLFIGGWVLFWEMFSIYFFHIGIFNKKINIYKRFLTTKIEYRYK